MDWTDKKSRSSVEMNDKSFRPPLADKNADIASYDTIFLGFPIWWYVAPTIVNTFLESCDFSGKRIILFATSGSSGMGSSASDMYPSASGAKWLDGRRFGGGASKESVEEWIDSLGLDFKAEDDGMIDINVKVGGKTYSAKLYDNDATRAWTALFPVTYDMNELNGNEKYKYLDGELPANAESIDTVNAGDIMLYGSDCVVLFYKTFDTSYRYTKLGRIDDPSGLETAVGGGNVTVTFERAN